MSFIVHFLFIQEVNGEFMVTSLMVAVVVKFPSATWIFDCEKSTKKYDVVKNDLAAK